MRKLFGTDGVRGVANIYPMTTEIAMQLGRGVAYVFKDKNRRHRIVIGKDTRLSGYMIENAIASGICSMGVDVLLVGPLPTPGIAFLTKNMRADAGVVISASHNPFQDNGIKFFSGSGFKLPDATEQKIEDLIFSKEIDSLRPTADEVGKAFRIDDATGRYIVFLKNTFPSAYSLDGLRIVLDCAHGAAYKVAPIVFGELGADLTLLGVNPDGTNINRGCGALDTKLLQNSVREQGAHLGIALDGDADRVIFVDEKGNKVDGDHIMAICASMMAGEKKLRKKTLVTTVMSNMGLEVCMRNMGVNLVRTQVGDRYVVEEMVRGGYNFGGEQSGHLVFLDHITTGDGILAALQLLAIICKTGRPLSELAKIMESYPQKLINMRVSVKKDLDEINGFKKKLAAAERELGGRGRVLVRFSGTEPLVRVMVEGEREDQIEALAQDLALFLEKALK
ncbi:MAG: phosphoglucosamine mutase [Desulfovibrionales bacterium]|nr:phosphoglucosamine mutase [Desulfovibrionales bacterium]